MEIQYDKDFEKVMNELQANFGWSNIDELPDSYKDLLNDTIKAVKNCSIHAVSGCLYAFLYNSCIHESSWATISLHYSKEVAEPKDKLKNKCSI